MPESSVHLTYGLGECETDLARRELRVHGSPMPVGARAFEIMEVLARAAGELVTMDELMDRIWPGAIILENTLRVHAVAIRKALGPYRGLLKTGHVAAIACSVIGPSAVTMPWRRRWAFNEYA